MYTFTNVLRILDKTFPNLISTAMRYDHYDYDSKV